MNDDGQKKLGKPNRYGSLLRLVLFLLAVAALIIATWWVLYDIEHQFPTWPGLLP